MHRFFVPPESFQNGGLVVRGDQAHQISDILHLRPGEVIAALDGRGDEFRIELTLVTHRAVNGRVLDQIEAVTEPRTHLLLYQSLLKAGKLEWVLQKGTEIGIAEFFPVTTSRAIVDSVGQVKFARWERIIIEAAEQSGRSKIPSIHPVQELVGAFAQVRSRGGLALIPWEKERLGSLRSVLSECGADAPISLFIGPEGGFDDGEIEAALAQGVHPVSLGPRILRAETAGLVAASAILFERGELDPRPLTR